MHVQASMEMLNSVMWCLVLSKCTVSVLGYDDEDVFSSMDQVKKLAETEHGIVAEVEKYIKAEEERLQDIQKTLHMYRDYQVLLNETQMSRDVEHPIQAYHLIKWMTRLLNKCHPSFIDNISSTFTDVKLPKFGDETDMLGIRVSILNLQTLYNLPTEELAKGIIRGQEVMPLDVEDRYFLGKVSMLTKNYDMAIEWFKNTLEFKEQLAAEKLSDTYCHLAVAYNMTGNYELALTHMEKAYNLDLNNMTKSEMLSSIRQIGFGEEMKNVISNYESLCRGDQNHTSVSRLGCRYYCPGFQYYCFKEEVLNLDPYISQYFEVIHDSEIDLIIHFARNSLKRAKVIDVKNNSSVTLASDGRITKTAWIPLIFPLMEGIDKRIQYLSGLQIENASEPLQVANYGVGGFYNMHRDILPGNDEDGMTHSLGNRVATFMFYLSDVTAGGATVFPLLNVRIAPVKGAAAFWFNMKRGGLADLSTLHAACPVLLGDKWAANKWIREYDQMFDRPCGLLADAGDVDRFL